MAGHLESLTRASFDFNFYAGVFRQRTRRTIAYLALLSLLAAGAFAAWGTIGLRGWVRRLEPHIDKIPTITIRNGEASANVEQPWTKRLGRDEHGREVVLIIDTREEPIAFEPEQVGVFLQKKVVLLKGDGGELRSVPLDHVRDVVIGPELIKRVIARVMRWAPWVMLAAAFAYYFVMRALQALLLVLVGLASAGKRKRPFSFGQLYTLSVYALTPAVLLDASRRFVPFHVPWFWAIYAGLAVLYVWLVASRMPDEE